jgi:CheY-like chemotaxis protein/HPt (histidine-containing phosphotransfer) domain-containing protein
LPIRQKKKNIEFMVVSTPGIQKNLIGDPYRVQQILINLVGNAFKFTDKKGQVFINVESVKNNTGEKADQGKENNTELKFSVSDTGLGIPAEKIKMLFKPFTQADKSITRKYGGTGLGLTISRKLVELMGGHLWAESEPGQGSIFIFTVNFRIHSPGIDKSVNSQPVKLDRIEDNQKQIYGASILVADANPDNLKITRAMLDTAGVKMTGVTSGSKVLPELEKGQFDALIMGVRMPGLNGHETTRLLRKDPRFKNLPIIAMTAYALKGDRQICLAAGMDDYLAKPVNRKDLFAVLAKYTTAKKINVKDGEKIINDSVIKNNSSLSEAPLAFPDIDTRDAIKRLGISKDVYLKILEKFFYVNTETTEKLTTHLAAREWDLLRKKAHLLKGSSANIGAVKLQKSALELEQLLREGRRDESIQMAVDRLVICLSRTLNSIKPE